MPEPGRRLENLRRLRMWTQGRLAREAGVSPTTVSGIETGKIERPHFGTLGRLARALEVAPEELLEGLDGVGSGGSQHEHGPQPMSLRWAKESGEGEFESRLEESSLGNLDSLTQELDAEQERLQRLYGEFAEGSEQALLIKQQIRHVAGRAGSAQTSAMVRSNQEDARREDESELGT